MLGSDDHMHEQSVGKNNDDLLPHMYSRATLWASFSLRAQEKDRPVTKDSHVCLFVCCIHECIASDDRIHVASPARPPSISAAPNRLRAGEPPKQPLTVSGNKITAPNTEPTGYPHSHSETETHSRAWGTWALGHVSPTLFSGSHAQGGPTIGHPSSLSFFLFFLFFRGSSAHPPNCPISHQQNNRTPHGALQGHLSPSTPAPTYPDSTLPPSCRRSVELADDKAYSPQDTHNRPLA